MKTFIKWTGNKSRVVRHLAACMPKTYHKYVEPFVGSGALLLHVQPKEWIINDLNKDLIRMWRLVKYDPQEIEMRFQEFGTHFTQREVREQELMCRQWTEGLNHMKANRVKTILIMLMIYCAYLGSIFFQDKYYFHGLEQNIKISRRYPFLSASYFDNLYGVSHFLRQSRGRIQNQDYRNVLAQCQPNDFVFLDPPYSDNKFQYNFGETIDLEFLYELKRQCTQLHERGVFFMMTHQNHPTIRKLFQEFHLDTYRIYRRRKNQFEKELMIRNYQVS